MQYPVCKHCGGHDITADAMAYWDKTTREWTLETTYDQKYCQSCEGETSIIWVKEDQKLLSVGEHK